MMPCKFVVLIYLLFLSLNSNCQKKIENERFFCDTTMVWDGYSIELKQTFTQNRLFVWTTAVITNTTDNYLLIDKDSISVSSKRRKADRSLYHRIIVVPPHETIRFPLKFKAKDNETTWLTFNFNGMSVTNNITIKHAATQMPLLLEETANIGDLKLTILRADLKDVGLAVRLRVQYKGKDFVKQNVYAMSLLSSKSDSCFNFREYHGVTYISPNSKNELLWLVFPRDCALETKALKRVLVLKDVFTEYSTKPISGVKVSVSYVRGE